MAHIQLIHRFVLSYKLLETDTQTNKHRTVHIVEYRLGTREAAAACAASVRAAKYANIRKSLWMYQLECAVFYTFAYTGKSLINLITLRDVIGAAIYTHVRKNRNTRSRKYM